MRLIDADELLEKMYRYTDNEGAKMPYGDNDSLIHKDSACFLIENAPTIEPERKNGKWIYGKKSGLDGWYCSECGCFIPWDYVFYGLDNIDFIEDFKTCPFCDSKMVSYTGADMREGEEE